MLKKLGLNEQTASIVLGAIIVILAGVLGFNWFSQRVKFSPPQGTTDIIEQLKQIENKDTGVQTTATQAVEVKGGKTHTVTVDENLWVIAEKYYGSGYNWVDIARENQLSNPGLIVLGQTLKIPEAKVIKVGSINGPAASTIGPTITGNSYIVAKGDNLWNIAVRAYGDGFKWAQIAQANNLANPGLIYSGNVLVISR